MLSEEVAHERFICEDEYALAERFVGVNGAWVSAVMVMLAEGDDLAETFPEASYAAMV